MLHVKRMGRPIATCALCLSLLLLCAASCSKEKGERKFPQQASVGQPSEVLLVLDEELQGSDVSDSLEAVLKASVPVLNQVEPFFRLTRIPQSMHRKNFLAMHSKVLVQIDRKATAATMGVAYDVYAQPQCQVRLVAPSLKALRGYVSTHGEALRRVLLQAQLKRYARFLAQHHSKRYASELKEVLGHTLHVPEEIAFTKRGKDCLWGSSRTAERQLNVVCYALPYEGQDLLDVEGVVHLRDSVLRINIPGGQPDQWMETVWEQDKPVASLKLQAIAGKRVWVLEGLWQMHNDAMGGPFISHAYLDTLAQRWVVAEGFVYSPSTSKRDLLRKLQAALLTLTKSSS